MTRQTVRELTPAVGSVVLCRFEEMYFQVKVLDAKNSYGKVRLLVQPVSGNGTQWVETHRLGSPVAEITITPTKHGFNIERKNCAVCGEPPFGSEYACGHM